MTPATASEPYCAEAPVGEHLHPLDRAMAGMTERSGPLRALRRLRDQPRDNRAAAVAPLAVDHDQGVVGGEGLRMFGGAHDDGGAVGDGLSVHAEGRDRWRAGYRACRRPPCSRSRSPLTIVTGDFDSVAASPARRVPTTTISSMVADCAPVSGVSAWAGNASGTGRKNRPVTHVAANLAEPPG